jgi:cyanophycin synthetase
LTKIKIDPITLKVLTATVIHLDSVPNPKEKFVYLRENGNLSTGGTAMDVTDEVCLKTGIWQKELHRYRTGHSRY